MKLNSFFNFDKSKTIKNSQEKNNKEKSNQPVEKFDDADFFITEGEKAMYREFQQDKKNKQNALLASLLVLASFAGLTVHDSLTEELSNENLVKTELTKNKPTKKLFNETHLTKENTSSDELYDNPKKDNYIYCENNYIPNIKPDYLYDTQTQKTMNKYISGAELLNCVNFDELKQYQNDISVLKAMISIGMNKIERNDSKRSEKFHNEVAKTQNFINDLVKDYKLKANIEGNSNFDNKLSKGEVVSMLNYDSLHDLPDYIKQKIIITAVKGYKPLYFQVNNEQDVQKVNKKILKTVQPIQDEIDKQAEEMQRAFLGNNNLANN